ncbi:MAG: MFS transporter [Anaerolineales bacterium]|nr:MAG: MFS transporter [Anaerolineales bacterium]
MDPSTTISSTELVSPARAGRIRKTMGYYAAFVALGLSAASLGPTLSGLAKHTQTRLHEISFLFMARSLGYLFGSLLGGRSYDRVSGHPVMATALIVMAVMITLAPLMSLLWLLTAVLLILGVAEGTLDVGGNTLLVWTHRDKVGPFMNGLHFCYGAGAFLSPILVAQAVLMSGDITWAYWVLALLMLPTAVWLLRLSSSTTQAASRDKPVGQVNHRSTGAHERLLVALIALFFVLHVGAESSFGGWVYTYAVALELTSETVAAYLTSAYWGSLTLGRLLVIPLAARFRPRSILLGDLVGCLAGVGVILLWPNSLTALWLGTLVLGLSIASLFPVSLSLAERCTTITGQVTGWLLVGASVGGMSLPSLIGQLFESVGPRVTMLAIMVDLVVAVGVFAVLVFYSTRPVMDDGHLSRDPNGFRNP